MAPPTIPRAAADRGAAPTSPGPPGGHATARPVWWAGLGPADALVRSLARRAPPSSRSAREDHR